VRKARLLTPALSSFGEEREKNFCGTIFQGGVHGELALGYYLSPLQGCGLAVRKLIFHF
jgi:hypothetical protein